VECDREAELDARKQLRVERLQGLGHAAPWLTRKVPSRRRGPGQCRSVRSPPGCRMGQGRDHPAELDHRHQGRRRTQQQQRDAGPNEKPRCIRLTGVHATNCRKSPKRSTTKPKPINAIAERCQTSNVRSAANRTRGSWRSPVDRPLTPSTLDLQRWAGLVVGGRRDHQVAARAVAAALHRLAQRSDRVDDGRPRRIAHEFGHRVQGPRPVDIR